MFIKIGLIVNWFSNTLKYNFETIAKVYTIVFKKKSEQRINPVIYYHAF